MKILIPSRSRPKGDIDYNSFTHKICNRCKQILPIEQFSKSKAETKRGWAYRSYCKPCSNEMCSIYSKNNRERRNTYLRGWRKQNPELARKNDKKGRLKSKYGMSIKDYDEMVIKQNKKCAICNNLKKRLVIDHDHKTGKVRGLLCDSCNHLLGFIDTYPEGIIKYLKNQSCHADVLIEFVEKITLDDFVTK